MKKFRFSLLVVHLITDVLILRELLLYLLFLCLYWQSATEGIVF